MKCGNENLFRISCFGFSGVLPKFPEANIKEFWVTILSEAKPPQNQCMSPEGEFWVCSEASFGMVQNSFQKAKGNSGNKSSGSNPCLRYAQLFKTLQIISAVKQIGGYPLSLRGLG